MACSLKSSSGSDSHFTAQPGPVTLKTAPAQGKILFTSQCSIHDKSGNDVAFSLNNNNQSLQFTAEENETYTLFLPFAFLPPSSFGSLVEDCQNSALSFPLVNINHSVSLIVDCQAGENK